ncbi:MAG: serine kinase [Bacteroidales bacterium]|nr:serine kinase [Bacteroidales bacterium]
MNIITIIDKLGLTQLSEIFNPEQEINGGYTSDLLSDVMGNASEGEVWITMQTHKNIIAVASLKELAAIIIVNNHKPEKDTIEAAEKEQIPLLGTNNGAFEISGEIYNLLK